MRFGERDLLALLPCGTTAIIARVHRVSASFCLAGNIRQPFGREPWSNSDDYGNSMLFVPKRCSHHQQEFKLVACRPERAEDRFATALHGLRQLPGIAALAAHEARIQRSLLRFRQGQLSRDSREFWWAFNSQGTGAQDAVFVQ